MGVDDVQSPPQSSADGGVTWCDPVTMAIVSSFLCWSNTRTGSALCGYYSLVVSVICVSLYVFRYLAQGKIDAVPEYKGIVYPGFVLYTVMIGVSLILLPGVYMDKRFLLLPWVYTLVVIVLYETGAIALLTTVHLSQDKTLRDWEIASLCFYCFRLVANCYCFACVVSQYQELSEGRGTYEYLYKPRRRRRLSQPLADGDLYSPPCGTQLPPYSEVDLHTEFNPPVYEAYDNPAFVTPSSASLSASLECCRGLQSEHRTRDHTHVGVHDASEDEREGRGSDSPDAHWPTQSTQPTQPTQYLNVDVHADPERTVHRTTYVTWI